MRSDKAEKASFPLLVVDDEDEEERILSFFSTNLVVGRILLERALTGGVWLEVVDFLLVTAALFEPFEVDALMLDRFQLGTVLGFPRGCTAPGWPDILPPLSFFFMISSKEC